MPTSLNRFNYQEQISQSSITVPFAVLEQMMAHIKFLQEQLKEAEEVIQNQQRQITSREVDRKEH